MKLKDEAKRQAIIEQTVDINGVRTMTKLFAKLRQSEQGATAIEYGLIAALVAVAAIGGMGAVGTQLNTKYTEVSTTLDTAGDAP